VRAHRRGCETVEEGFDGIEGREVDVAGVGAACAEGEGQGGFEGLREVW